MEERAVPLPCLVLNVLLLLAAGSLAAQEAQPPRRYSLGPFDAASAPRPAVMPPARPCQPDRDEEADWLRLGYESEFLFGEEPLFLDEDEWAGLLDILETPSAQLEERLEAIGPRPIRLRYRLGLEEDGELSVLLHGSEPVRPGAVTVFSEQETREALVDFDIQIAQAASIADPVTARLVTGPSLAVKLQPVGGGWLAQVVARNSYEEPNEEIPLGATGMQGARRNPQGFEEAGCVLRLPQEGPLEAELPGRDGRRFRLHLAVEGAAPTQEDLRLVWLPTLVDPPLGFRAPRPLGVTHPAQTGAWLEQMPEPPVRPFDELAEEILDETGADLVLASAGGLILLEDDEAYHARQALMKAAEEAARGAELSVELLLHGPPDAAAPRSLGRFRAPVVFGLDSGFSAGRIREAVTEWDVEVAQAARAPDPVFALVEDGVRGTLRLLPPRPAHAWEIDVDLQVARLVGFTPTEIRLARKQDAHDLGAAVMPMQPEDRVILEEPRVSSLSIAGRYRLEERDGTRGLVLQRSCGKLFGPGSFLELKVEVR